MTIFYNLLYM